MRIKLKLSAIITADTFRGPKTTPGPHNIPIFQPMMMELSEVPLVGDTLKLRDELGSFNYYKVIDKVIDLENEEVILRVGIPSIGVS